MNPQWMARFTVMIRTIGGYVVSIGLLIADMAGRAFTRTIAKISPYLPSYIRLVAIGLLSGGCVAGGLAVAWRSAPLVPSGASGAMVAIVWAIALTAWGIAAILYIVVKTSASVLGGIAYRLTDIARPVVVSEQRRSSLGGSDGGMTLGNDTPLPGSPTNPKFRDPGNLAEDSSSFRSYSDEEGALREVIGQMRGQGVSEENIQELVQEFERGTQKQT